MKEQLKLLIELQEAELALRRIDEKKKEWPEKLAALSAEIEKADAKVGEHRTRYEELIKRHRDKEDKLKKESDYLKRTRDRLYEVKTNKEYQAVLKEIEVTEGKCSEFESEIINLLDEIENVGMALKKEEENQRSQRILCQEEQKKIENELAKLEEVVVFWQSKNDVLRQKIAPDVIKKYETIKQANAGIAVVSVWKAVCGGCHMNIPPQLYNELQKTLEFNYCPNCRRIIYYDQNHEPE